MVLPSPLLIPGQWCSAFTRDTLSPRPGVTGATACQPGSIAPTTDPEVPTRRRNRLRVSRTCLTLSLQLSRTWLPICKSPNVTMTLNNRISTTTIDRCPVMRRLEWFGTCESSLPILQVLACSLCLFCSQYDCQLNDDFASFSISLNKERFSWAARKYQTVPKHQAVRTPRRVHRPTERCCHNDDTRIGASNFPRRQGSFSSSHRVSLSK